MICVQLRGTIRSHDGYDYDGGNGDGVVGDADADADGGGGGCDDNDDNDDDDDEDDDDYHDEYHDYHDGNGFDGDAMIVVLPAIMETHIKRQTLQSSTNTMQ